MNVARLDRLASLRSGLDHLQERGDLLQQHVTVSVTRGDRHIRESSMCQRLIQTTGSVPIALACAEPSVDLNDPSRLPAIASPALGFDPRHKGCARDPYASSN